MIGQKYPYTDLHELNLDFILRKIKEMRGELSEFEALNTVSYEGLWDITKSYAKWSIVFDNEYAYIALQPVPAGILLTNPDYWQNIGTIYSDIQKRYIFISDSYGYKEGLGYDTWIELLPVYLGLQANQFSTVVDNGGAFVTAGDKGTWEQALRNEASNIPEHSTITDIIIGGWINDFNKTTGQIETAVTSFCDYVKDEFPNAKITVLPISWSLQSTNINLTTAAQSVKVIEAYREALLLSGIGCIMDEAISILRNSDYFNGDLIHPNNQGELYISKCMAEYIKTGNCNMTEYKTPTITPSDTNITWQGAMQSWHNGKNVGLTATQAYCVLTFDTPVTISNSTYEFILTDYCNSMINAVQIPITGVVYDTSNTLYLAPGYIQFSGAGFNIWLSGPVNNAKKVYLMGIGFSGDCLMG